MRHLRDTKTVWQKTDFCSATDFICPIMKAQPHNSYAQKSYFFRDAILWKNNVSRKTRLIYFQMLKLKNDQQRFVFIFFRSSIKRRDFLYCSPWTDISPRRKPIGMRCGAKSVKQVRFKISWHFDGVSEIFLIELPFFIHAKSNRS